MRCLIAPPFARLSCRARCANACTCRHAARQSASSAHHGWIQRWLARKLGNVSDAAELAHDVFVRLLTHPREFGSDGHARAYLSTLSRNVCVDFFRRKQVEQAWLEVLASRPEACAPSEEHRALVLEALVHLQAMLDRLPVKVSEAFCLAQNTLNARYYLRDMVSAMKDQGFREVVVLVGTWP